MSSPNFLALIDQIFGLTSCNTRLSDAVIQRKDCIFLPIFTYFFFSSFRILHFPRLVFYLRSLCLFQAQPGSGIKFSLLCANKFVQFISLEPRRKSETKQNLFEAFSTKMGNIWDTSAQQYAGWTILNGL